MRLLQLFDDTSSATAKFNDFLYIFVSMCFRDCRKVFMGPHELGVVRNRLKNIAWFEDIVGLQLVASLVNGAIHI